MRAITFLIKPASSLCNLRCKYCFYEDEAANRSAASMGIMTREMAELLISRAYSAADPNGSISFAFQGGEPTVAGLDFFRNFVKTAKAQKPTNVQISFSIQTNGILLDEAWAQFFRDAGFLVGVSLDGCRDLHDLYRVDAKEEGTWKRVESSVKLLNQYRVPVNALCVVTGQCAGNAQKVYENLKKMDFRYQQFIACLDPLGCPRGTMPWSLSPKDYGNFLCQLFDLWYRDWEHGDYHSIRLFEDYVHILLGDGGSTCATCGNCGGYFVVEADGSVYPCDFFVLDEWKVGSLREQSLDEIRNSEAFLLFLSSGREKPAACATCQWSALCNGGCKNDWTSKAEDVRNYYCDSFKMLFAHANERMQRIARAEWEARRRMRIR